MEVTRPDSFHSLNSITTILSAENKIKSLEDYEKQFEEVNMKALKYSFKIIYFKNRNGLPYLRL